MINNPLAPKPNILVRIINKAANISDSIMGFMMLGIAVLTVIDVSMRHFFAKPTSWIYTVCVYALIWYSFIVAAQALVGDHHIKVDMLINLLHGKARIATDALAYLFITIYSGMLSYFAFTTMAKNIRMGAKSIGTVRIPLWLVQLGIVLGAVLLCLEAVNLLAHKIVDWKRAGFKPGKGIHENPYIVLVIFIVVFAAGLWVFSFNRGFGMIITVFAVLLVGVPVFAGLGMVGAIGLYIMMGAKAGVGQIATIAQKGVESYTLLAIPLFVLAGNLLVESGIGAELYDFCAKWAGHLPGGIAIATIVACAIFAAISGSSVATAAIIGSVALPELKKYKYDTNMSLGLLAAGGTLGILIPPSSSMIVYSTITEESTGKLFMGGVIPGIIMAIIFSVYAVVSCKITGKYEKMPKASWGDRGRNLVSSIWGLLTPVIILASIYTGFCTPTEAAAVAVIYALAVSLIRKKISLKDIPRIVKMGNGSAGMIMMIVAGALIFGNLITITQAAQNIINYVAKHNIAPGLVLLVMCFLFVILGMFLEVISIMYITMPIVFPLMTGLGYNGIWFGVFVTLLMEMALITPPVGLNSFVIQGISKEPMAKVIRGVLPFMLLLALGLALLYLFPELALWLPSEMA